jgi:hypothetical protein
MFHLLPLLLALAASPAAAQGTAPGSGLHYEPARGQRGAPPFEHRQYRLEVTLDGDEGLEIVHGLDLQAGSGASLPDWVPVAILDRAAGDRCEAGGGYETTVQPAPPGYEHLGAPALCLVGPIPPRTRRLEVEVTVIRPGQGESGEATTWLHPVQPLFGAARSYRFTVEGPSERAGVVAPLGWSAEIASEPIARDRWRWSADLEAIAPLAGQPGQTSNAGRAPQWSVSTVPDWEAAARVHRAAWDSASEAHGPVLPLAGRVLGIRDPVGAVREAVRIALGTIALEPEGGGGLFVLPRPAEQTVEDGAGRAVDRAALLVALLRTAELRAEVVFASPSAMEPDPRGAVVPLSRVLVLVPGVALEPSGDPLYIDPAMGPSWLGALDESLLGVNAFLPGEGRARWLRLGEAPPRRRWAWSAAESADGTFQVQVTGLLEGAPAARVRDWVAAGRPADARPAALAFLENLGQPARIEAEETSGGRLQVLYTGTLSRSELLARDGTLRVPALPSPALGTPGKRFAQPRDALRFDLEATESWTFRGMRSGTAPRTDERSTPFWQVDAAASWTGPVFNRRYRLRFTARELAALAAGNVEAFQQQVAATLGGIKAPSPAR